MLPEQPGETVLSPGARGFQPVNLEARQAALPFCASTARLRPPIWKFLYQLGQGSVLSGEARGEAGEPPDLFPSAVPGQVQRA